MFRSGWLLLALACVAGAALGAVPRPPADAVVRGALDAVPVEDPFPIRRVRAPGAKLPDLLKDLDPGPVVRLPRGEFETRVRAAGLAAAQAKHGPRVVEASYTAEFDGGDLVGTARLSVLNAGGPAAFLSLDPLRLGVQGAKWGEKEDAILVVPPGAAAPAVWVAGEGQKALQFRWSLAGAVQPGERRFELKVPVCASAVLELDLPGDRVPTALTDALLTGPFDVPGKPGGKRWRFRFGGRPRLEFAVRPTGAPSAGAAAALVAKYELGQNQLVAAFEYELRPARGAVSEWSFLADPGLRVTEAVANNRAGWTVEPPAAPNGPARVKVTLRQPAAGGKVLITAVAPLPDPARPADAPLPAVRPVGAVVESESVELRVAPGLKIESWAPGDYHLTDATTGTDLARVLSLTGALLAPGSDEPFRRMPSVRVVNPESEFHTFERLEWSPGPASSRLVARVGVRVSRGPLFQLVVRPPAGFTLDRAAATTDELIAHIGTPGGGGQTIELARPLLTGQQADLQLEFRGPGVRPGAPVPFPTLAVVGATERDGWLSVSAAPACGLKLRPGAGATRAGLWGWLATDAPADARAVYLYRAKEPDGTLTLSPAAPKLKADTVVSLTESGGRWLATARFFLTPTGGPTDAAVFVPGPHDGARTWALTGSDNAVASAVPVPAQPLVAPVGAPLDLGANLVGARVRAGVGEGTLWFVRFAHPLTSTVVLETAAPGPPVQTPEFVLGVPRLSGADQVTRVELAPPLRSRVTAELSGAELLVRDAGALAGQRVTDAYLLTAVRDPREVVAAFGATVRDSAGDPLSVALPDGAEVRGVCVDGRWLGPSACALRGDGALRVPLPTGAAVRFEVRYRLPTEAGWPTRRVVSPVPVVEGAPAVSRWWSFADGVLPGWPVGVWDAAADEPPLLGGPLTSGTPALVARSDDERVRVGAVRTADAGAAALVALTIALGVAVRRARLTAALGAAGLLALAVAELGPPWWARCAWPVLGAAALVLARALWSAAARPRAAAAGVLGGVVLFGPLGLVAQPPAAATVFIVAADGGEEVVTSGTVLERLDALTHPVPPAPLVTAAAYDVKADDAGARVTARFVAHALRPSDNVLVLPLGDARLERVTVNGALAFPVALKPDTYAVPLGAAGRYEIEVRFAAGVTVTGAERDLRFGAPDVPDTRLTAALPAAARQPQAVGRLGRQATVIAGDRVTVEADLGAVKQVHLRWSEGGSGAAAVKVREACVWDVTDGGAELTAAYLVRVEQGAVAGLRVDVPAELEVLRVAVRAPDAIGPAPALQDWQLGAEKGGFRALRIDFPGPFAGRFLVVLECGPRKPLTRQPVLRFPRLVLGSVKGETEPVYALRAARVTVDEVGRAGVIDFSADALRDFVPVSDLKLDPAHLPRAFRPVPGASAELRPVLRAGDGPTVLSSTAWVVGPTRADAVGTLSWSGDAPVSLLEFSVPGARVLEVRGPDVAGWGRAGGRVQVWLRSGAREGAVEWLATHDLGGKPAAETPFEPVTPVLAGGKLASVEVRVRAVPGWAVRPDRARGWQTAPAPASELRFRTAGPPAQNLRVQVVPLPNSPR